MVKDDVYHHWRLEKKNLTLRNVFKEPFSKFTNGSFDGYFRDPHKTLCSKMWGIPLWLSGGVRNVIPKTLLSSSSLATLMTCAPVFLWRKIVQPALQVESISRRKHVSKFLKERKAVAALHLYSTIWSRWTTSNAGCTSLLVYAGATAVAEHKWRPIVFTRCSFFRSNGGTRWKIQGREINLCH